MKKVVLSFLPMLVFILVIISCQALAAQEEKSIPVQGGQNLSLYKDCCALVVGVGNYDQWPDLPNAVNDAKEVSRFFRQRAFKVKLLTDPGSQELKKALDDFVREAGQEQDRAIVFYYVGHGKSRVIADGTRCDWIIPRDCPLLQDNPQGFDDRAIDLKALVKFSTLLRSKHVLMLFDASFSGTAFSYEPAALKIIDRTSALPVRQYIIAGKEGERISEQSVFKQFLLKGLEGEADLIYDGYITGSELGHYLIDMVEKVTAGWQHPQYAKASDPALAGGDFIFLPVEVKSESVRLFVETDPKDAQVKILNINPRFEQGMELEPGKYHLEVSASGCTTKQEWITLEPGEDKKFEIHLEKEPAKEQEQEPGKAPGKEQGKESGKGENALFNSLGMEFVFIKPGSFVMGSPAGSGGEPDDEKEHRVTISKGFYIQTMEVTMGQFRKFIQATGYGGIESEKKSGCWVKAEGGIWRQKKGIGWDSRRTWESAESAQTERHPVTCVTWNDAQAFIKWLSRKEGAVYDLPTEAEWEYACRAGTITPFSFGRCLSTDQANYDGIGPLFADCQGSYRLARYRPIETGSLAPNPWRLFDMHGNVAEWCQDWYAPYPDGPATDPKGPPEGTERVMRGGHWATDARGCCSARRWSLPPDAASEAVGFRLVVRRR
ncbi:MAG: SUMF1/EgtB/PvdO family nonheme iron enzyme [bacterium]